MDKKIEHVRKLRSEKKYEVQDEFFLGARNKYLERLFNREDIYDPAFEGLLDVIVDPRDEFELEYCQSILGFQDDVREIKSSCATGDIRRIDLDNSYAIKTISECIKLMRVDEVTPEVYDKVCAADPARLTYEMLVTSACDMDNFTNRLISESGFNADKLEELELFYFFYTMFFAFLKSVSTTSVMKEKTFDYILEEEIKTANRFHKLYLDGLSSNCTLDETYRGSNFQKGLK